MPAFFKIFATVLLLFNGTGAIYGGLSLMIFPDGSHLKMSVDWLQNTTFKDYFIPGLVLFVANGCFSVVVLTAIWLKHPHSSWLVIAQGAILSGWIIIQILLIQTVYYLHFILGGVGLSLILIGYLLTTTKYALVHNNPYQSAY